MDVLDSANINVGRKVLFVGGPEAGNVRVVPESHGDVVKADGDFLYRIHPFANKGTKQIAYFGYAEGENPLNLMIDMWREYSPVAQIKRSAPGIAQTYQKMGGK